MRKTLFTLLLFVLTETLFSQQGPLLQKFKYRISNYRAINYSINGNGQFDKTDFVSGTRKSSAASGGFGAAYYKSKSTDRILLTASGSLYSSFNVSQSNIPGNVNTNKSFYVMPGISVLNKWFSEKNHFTELGADVSSDYNLYNYTATGFTGPAKNKQGYYSIAINTGVGKGRLENITDMQNALWLNKELEEAKLLSRPLSDEELNELGQSITKGNNTRVLDVRRRTQFILKTVDNYFQGKGLIKKTDINYFAELNDILFFAVNSPRLSGTEKYIRFTPAISGGSQNVTQYNLIDKYEQRNGTRSLLFTSGFNKYIPVSLTHQNNYGASLKLAYTYKQLTDRNFISGVVNETKSSTALKQAGVNMFFQHTIYPNTRTILIFNFQSETGYQDIARQSGFYGGADFSAIFHYFISYRTRLNFNVGASYQKNLYYSNQYFNLLPDRILLNANFGLEISL